MEKDRKQNFKTPSITLFRMQMVHFGKILFNLQFIAPLFVLSNIITAAMYVIYYLILFAITMFTLFTVFIWYPEFGNWWQADYLNQFFQILSGAGKYVLPISICASILSTVCLCFDKNEKHIKRIVINSLVLVVLIIASIMINNQG